MLDDGGRMGAGLLEGFEHAALDPFGRRAWFAVLADFELLSVFAGLGVYDFKRYAI